MLYPRITWLAIQIAAVVEIDVEGSEVLTNLGVTLEQITIEGLLPGGGMHLVCVGDDTIEMEDYCIEVIS